MTHWSFYEKSKLVKLFNNHNGKKLSGNEYRAEGYMFL